MFLDIVFFLDYDSSLIFFSEYSSSLNILLLKSLENYQLQYYFGRNRFTSIGMLAAKSKFTTSYEPLNLYIESKNAPTTT